MTSQHSSQPAGAGAGGSRVTTLLAAVAGVVATLLGMAVGQLVAAVVNPDAAPVIAVGSTVIDLTPTPVKDWAIAHFGTNDKTVLLSSVVVVTLVLAALAGILARRVFALGVAVLLLLVVLSGVAAIIRPQSGPGDALPALGAAIVGVATLAWLSRRLPAAGEPAADPVGDEDGPSSSPTAGRRGILIGLGVGTLAAAATAGLGRLITASRTNPGDITLPPAAKPLPRLPQGLAQKVPGISPFQTPNGDFYRVDTRLTLPLIDTADWSLTIDGDVDHQVTFTLDDLLKMPLVERDITLTCVSNDVGGPYVSSARWLGVPLTDLLARAGIDHTRADQILSTDVDGITISTPLELATDGRDSMIAVGMNGTALPLAHGFPARMVVPGLYGFVSACKWITRMTLTSYHDEKAYWTKRGWATDAPIKVSSRIDTPKSFEEINAGETFIGGIAWAQHHGVAKVEVQIDGGSWQPAELGPSAGNDYWRQWYFPWKASKGEHQVSVRATTQDGEVQTAARAMPFPDGSSGLQKIVVRVA